MVDAGPGQEQQLAAGDFSAWMEQMSRALDGHDDADVPCGTCTACCTSSQFIHVAPDETETLAHIPAALRFPAPGRPRGHVLLGYDQRGHCPMLVDNRCSIYEYRPRTCRTYDCRVFPAAGVDIEAEDKALVAQQARRWRFSYASETDRRQHDAVRAAATYLATHPEVFPDGAAPTGATQLAVLAIEAHVAFLTVAGVDAIGTIEVAGDVTRPEPDPHEVRVALTRRPSARRP